MKTTFFLMIVILLNGLVAGGPCPKPLCAGTEPRCPTGSECKPDNKGIERCYACPEGVCACPQGYAGPGCAYIGCFITFNSTACINGPVSTGGITYLGVPGFCLCLPGCNNLCCFDADCAPPA